MKSLAILGASGHGKVVAEAAELSGWSNIVFFDDGFPQKQSNSKWAVIGTSEDLLLKLNEFDGVHIAIGDNYSRGLFFSKLDSQKLVSIIHPSAVVSNMSHIGLGSIILAGAVVNADVSIGQGVIINTGATIDHDCVIGDFCHISPGANLAGNVIVGNNSWIGIGSAVIQKINIGTDVIIGAGSVVINSIPSSTTAVGVPCKVIKGAAS